MEKNTSHMVVLSCDPNNKKKTAVKIRGKMFLGRETASAKALRQERA